MKETDSVANLNLNTIKLYLPRQTRKFKKNTVKRGNIEQVINFKVILKILRDVL
jgi:hypothetical protein